MAEQITTTTVKPQAQVQVQPQPPAAAEEKVKRVARRKPAKKVDKTIVVKAKRKTTIARAYIKAGKGAIRINGKDITALEFDFAKDIMMEPITISDIAKDQIRKMDININIRGGGVSSQIQAIKGAIAKGIVEFSKSDALKKEYLNYDRSLLVDDPRRVESKKFKGPKARARFQTSYR